MVAMARRGYQEHGQSVTWVIFEKELLAHLGQQSMKTIMKLFDVSNKGTPS